MSFDPKTGRFDFSELREPLYQGISTEIGPTQRAQLRQLAQPGEPLWTIQKDMLEYARAIEKRLAMCDFNTADGLAQARALQAEGKAINWQMDMWERLLSEPLTEQAPHNGNSEDQRQ